MISIPPGPPTFVNTFGPPGEARGRADEVRPLLKRGAVGELGVFQVLDGSKVLVDEGGIGQRPQVLGRLQFGRVGREKQQVDMVGDSQLDAGGFPAGPIEHEHDLLAGTGSDLARKFRQLHCKQGNADGGRQMEDGPTGGGMDEADQITPRKAVLHGGNGPLPDGRPHAPQQRLYLFLKVSCCSASAKACRGRGTC